MSGPFTVAAISCSGPVTHHFIVGFVDHGVTLRFWPGSHRHAMPVGRALAAEAFGFERTGGKCYVDFRSQRVLAEFRHFAPNLPIPAPYVRPDGIDMHETRNFVSVWTIY
jgi:hypothetical protein